MKPKRGPRGRPRRFRPALALAALAALTLLPALGAAASPAEAPEPTEPVLQDPVPEDLALRAYHDFTLAMMDEEFEERDLNLLNLGIMEQQGMVSRGTYAAVKAYPADDQIQVGIVAPPVVVLRDIYNVCDLNGDSVDDIVANSIDLRTGRPYVQAFSGSGGFTLWIRYGLRYFPPGSIFPGYQPGTQPLPPNPFPPPNNPSGVPGPGYPQNFGSTIDINEDGVCDFLFMSQTSSVAGIDPQIIFVDTTYAVINGSYGYGTLWSSLPVRSTIVVTFDPPTQGGLLLCVDMVDFPTGLIHFFTPNGPRWARKTTTAHFCGTICAFDWRSTDTVHLQDVRRWSTYWSRQINMTRESNPTAKSQEKINNITHLMGAANLGGDDESEILLLQPQFATPGTTCNLNNPLDNTPLFRLGGSGTVLTLRGELKGGGVDFWKTLIYDQGTARVNLAAEESFEVVRWMWLQVVGDLNADKTVEIVVTFLGQEGSASNPTTVNGAYRTHVIPLSGVDGRKLWRGEPKVQGWGFVDDLNPTYNSSVPYLAIGTVDIPTPIPGAARFPPKDIRLAVFHTADGTPAWSYREQFSQDNYLSYEMSLNQFLNALAPFDWTGDGVKDVLTPSQYRPATGQNQTLLANAENRYQILDGVLGSVHAEIVAWGPTGIAVACGAGENGEGEPTVTTFTGHSRRYDISRFNVTPKAEQHWRFPVFNNPDIQSATLGADVVFVGPKCITTRHGTTLFAVNLGLSSLKRGLEIQAPYGVIGVQEDDLTQKTKVLWIQPPVAGKPPVSLDDILKYFEVEETHPGLMLALTAGPAVPGLVAGLGLGRLRLRKGGPE